MIKWSKDIVSFRKNVDVLCMTCLNRTDCKCVWSPMKHKSLMRLPFWIHPEILIWYWIGKHQLKLPKPIVLLIASYIGSHRTMNLPMYNYKKINSKTRHISPPQAQYSSLNDLNVSKKYELSKRLLITFKKRNTLLMYMCIFFVSVYVVVEKKKIKLRNL